MASNRKRATASWEKRKAQYEAKTGKPFFEELEGWPLFRVRTTCLGEEAYGECDPRPPRVDYSRGQTAGKGWISSWHGGHVSLYRRFGLQQGAFAGLLGTQINMEELKEKKAAMLDEPEPEHQEGKKVQ